MATTQINALCLALFLVPLLTGVACAEEEPTAAELKAQDEQGKQLVGTLGESVKPLNPKNTVFLDQEGKRLWLKTKVVLREGLLEMLCCPAQSKEHESIVSLDSKAYVVHAGLLALGAKPGKPASFQPKFQPATGQKVDIFLNWIDEKGKRQRVPAQDWIRYATHRTYVAEFDKLPAGLQLPERDDELPIRFHAKFRELTWYGPMSDAQRDRLLKLSQDAGYRKAIQTFYEKGQSRRMDSYWVFGGSGYYVDPMDGKKTYLAEAGDLICVVNFPTATLDLGTRSTDKQEEGLSFEPWTERIPPKGTPVLVELVPVFEKPAAPK